MAAAGVARVTRLIAENRRARFDYFLEENFEAGLALTGSEVKALREGRANIAESYAAADGNEISLVNAYIPEYGPANRFNHEPRRPRRLLLHRKQIDKLLGRGAAGKGARSSRPGSISTTGAWPSWRSRWPRARRPTTSAPTAERDWKREQGRLMRERARARCDRTGSSDRCSFGARPLFLGPRASSPALLPHRAARL